MIVERYLSLLSFGLFLHVLYNEPYSKSGYINISFLQTVCYSPQIFVITLDTTSVFHCTVHTFYNNMQKVNVTMISKDHLKVKPILYVRKKNISVKVQGICIEILHLARRAVPP